MRGRRGVGSNKAAPWRRYASREPLGQPFTRGSPSYQCRQKPSPSDLRGRPGRRSLADLTCRNAGGADPHSLPHSILTKDTNALEVGEPSTLRLVVGVTHPIPRGGPLAAHPAYSSHHSILERRSLKLLPSTVVVSFRREDPAPLPAPGSLPRRPRCRSGQRRPCPVRRWGSPPDSPRRPEPRHSSHGRPR